ncbi:MAG: hypothetical protein OXU67_03810 [Chloroflexota bacterium]|nr:hypothetical protein [Chloroflexota bacterium]
MSPAHISEKPLTAQQRLRNLREQVNQRYPGVRAVQADSATRVGEDRYELAPRNSLYVRAPLTPNGKPRIGGWAWRYRRSPRDPWSTSPNMNGVLRVILRLAAEAGHTPKH